MPLTIGRSRRSEFAKTVVKIPRKQVAGQPGLEPVNAPLTPLEKKVARIFVEALTFTPRQISKLLEEDESVGVLTPFLEHLEPARKELSDALMEQLDDSGAFFWNELVDQLKRKPDPSSVNFIAKNQIRKEIDPEDVTIVMPTGGEFTSSFSKRTPRGKRWADNESARLITNIAEETRENLQDVIASATGRGGRQRMMTLLGNVLENAPAGIDSGNVLTKFQSEVSPAVAGLTFKQHNAVINTANKAFDDALAKGLPFNKAVNAAEKEALAHGKRAREYRARMISRTEMMEASNRGKLEAAQQAVDAGLMNPHRAGRQWVTSTFDVCVTCEPLHGKVVAFEGGFFPAKYRVSGNWVEEPQDLPPAHPNCRCTWTVVYDTVVPPTATETGMLTPPKDVSLELLNRAWAEAGKLARSVASIQDEVTGVMVSVADDIGADMYGLQHATKTEASLARKITTDFSDEIAKDPTLTIEAVAEDIGDALRYTLIADAETYTDDVASALRDLEARGYTYKKAPKNFWRTDNLENPYNGINVNMRTPTGQTVEIQFHTPEGIDMKNRIHPIYERQRAIGVTQELKDELSEQMAEMVSVLDYPDNVTDLRFFPDEEIKYRLETTDDIVARFGGKWPEGSMDAYTDADGNWWQMRETLHENIIEEGLSKATPVEKPIVHFMGGGPASGKGTAIRRGLIDVPDNIVIVDADEIKDALPEYRALIDDRSSRAAAYVHEESSYLSKEMFSESIGSGRNTQLDGTGDSSMEKLRSKVASAREASSAQGGTKVIADYITIDTEEAVRRARRRAVETGRSVPESVVRETHASISRIFPDILDENLFDDVKLWDTAFDPPKLILRKVDGVLEIYDDAAYERFLMKNPDYVSPVDIESLSLQPDIDLEITERLAGMGDLLSTDDAGNFIGTPAYYADDVPIRAETGMSYADEVEVVGSFKERKQTLDVALEMVDRAFTPPNPSGGLSRFWDNRPKKIKFRYIGSKPKGKEGLGGSYKKRSLPDKPRRLTPPKRIKEMYPDTRERLDEWAKQRAHELDEGIAVLDAATGLPATFPDGKIVYRYDNLIEWKESPSKADFAEFRLNEINDQAMREFTLFEIQGYESAEEMMQEYYSYWYAQAQRYEEISAYQRGFKGESSRLIQVRPGTKGERVNTILHEIGHDFDYTQEVQLTLAGGRKMEIPVTDSNIDIIFDLYSRGKITKTQVGEQGLAYIEFMENVVESKAYKKLISKEVQDKMLNAGMSQAEISGYVQYATSPKEVWARAFNQWTATRYGAADSVEAMMNEAVDSFGNIGFQWDPEDFDTMVAPYLEKIFKVNGWVE
tara:strand:+ start:1085 stop:5047 length:3963 start_codon:yes stop_codon:yes gene_type:complete